MSKEEGVLTDMSGAEQEQEQKQQLTDAQIKMIKKRQEQEILEYKKRLTKAVELKRLQNEELMLNINYFKLKKEWLDIQPDIEKLEQREAKLLAEQQQKAENQKNTNEKKQPQIQVVNQGSPRGK